MKSFLKYKFKVTYGLQLGRPNSYVIDMHVDYMLKVKNPDKNAFIIAAGRSAIFLIFPDRPYEIFFKLVSAQVSLRK